MTVKELPKRLADVTLEQYVVWNDTFGKELLAKARTIDMSDPDKTMLFEADFMFKHYAHYSGTSLADIEAAVYDGHFPGLAADISKESAMSQAMLFREMCDLGSIDFVMHTFEFDNRVWIIKPPIAVALDKKLSVADFEACQKLALTLSDLQDGKFEALYGLCEEYLETTEGDKITSETLTKTLPLSIALAVKRYMSDTINLYSALVRDDPTATTS